MERVFRKADVYVQRHYAGKLSETDEGYSFIYDNDYLNLDDPLPVSLTMPVTEKQYFSKVLFTFFDGIIPEGWLLDIVTRNWKVDYKDRFGLLLLTCRDCIGNVSVVPEGEDL